MQPTVLTRILCRNDLMRGQITLLKELYERNEAIARDDLAKKLRGEIHEDYERSFTGVLGAFGNRINQTGDIPGSPGTDAFLEKNRIDGEIHYQLRPEAREAIKNIPALIEKFDEPWDELLEPNTQIKSGDLVPNS